MSLESTPGQLVDQAHEREQNAGHGSRRARDLSK